MFKDYFDSITLLKGGADTGFRRVLPESYAPRFFHIQKRTYPILGLYDKNINIKIWSILLPEFIKVYYKGIISPETAAVFYFMSTIISI